MKNNFQLVVGSGKGGVGKSMLASCLVIMFGKEKEVAGLDCDVDAPNLNIWLGETKWDEKEVISTTKKAVINNDLCNKCGNCEKVCRFGAIKKKEKVLKLFLIFVRGVGLVK